MTNILMSSEDDAQKQQSIVVPMDDLDTVASN